MRKFLFWAVLLAAAPLAAQKTSVTGTVIDPQGVPYRNGTLTATLVLAGGASPSVGGLAIGVLPVPGTLDSTGTFTLSLWDNNQISPAGSQWRFILCSNSPFAGPPWNTGPCTTTGLLTITGGSQNISSTLNSVALTQFPAPTGALTPTSIAVGGDTPFTKAPRALFGPCPINFVTAGATANLSGGNWCRFTPDNGISITRVEIILQGVTAAGCTTPVILRVTDGTTNLDTSLTNGVGSFSTSFSQNYAAGIAIHVDSVPGIGCTTAPAGALVTAQYKMQ